MSKQQRVKLTIQEQLLIETPIGFMVVSADDFAGEKKFYVTPPSDKEWHVKTSTSGTSLIVDIK